MKSNNFWLLGIIFVSLVGCAKSDKKAATEKAEDKDLVEVLDGIHGKFTCETRNNTKITAGTYYTKINVISRSKAERTVYESCKGRNVVVVEYPSVSISLPKRTDKQIDVVYLDNRTTCSVLQSDLGSTLYAQELMGDNGNLPEISEATLKLDDVQVVEVPRSTAGQLNSRLQLIANQPNYVDYVYYSCQNWERSGDKYACRAKTEIERGTFIVMHSHRGGFYRDARMPSNPLNCQK